MSGAGKILLKRVRVVDPRGKRDGDFDCMIEKGVLKSIGARGGADGATVIEGRELALFPGLVDLHTHLREPGEEQKETIESGCRAALHGGYTACLAMANTHPPVDNASLVTDILGKAAKIPFHLLQAGTITKGRAGKEISEMADLQRAGVRAVSDDGAWVADSLLTRRAMEYAAMLDLLYISHAEEPRLSDGAVMSEGFQSTALGLRGSPAEAESVAIARDLELARLAGVRLHIAHVSCARSLALIRRAKREGVRVTCDVTPHHLVLTDEAMAAYDANFKVNPPLRTREDQEALLAALKDGTVDAIATDHAPHTVEEKMLELDQAPFGVTGLETALAVVLTDLVATGKMSLELAIAKMSAGPAELLGLEGEGTLREGAVLNACLVDLAENWEVRAESFLSKSINSCFLGRKLKGRVLITFARGRSWDFRSGVRGKHEAGVLSA